MKKQPKLSALSSISKINLKEKIGLGERASYGIGGIAYNLSFAATNVFMIFFYTDMFGISAAAAGTIIFLSKILDAIGTILMGVLFDRTKSKYGKGRFWILCLAIPHSIAMVLAFFVPSLGITGKIIYAFVTYNLLMTVAWTGINLAYSMLGTRMTQDQVQRSDLSILRTIGALIGTVIVNMATLPIVKVFGNNSQAWTLVMAIYALMSAILFFITFFFTKERITSKTGTETVPEVDIPIWDSIRCMLKNKYSIMMMLLFTMNFIAQGLQSVFIYYCIYFLKDPKLVGTRSVVGLLFMFVVLIILSPIVKKLGKRNVSLIGTLIQLFGCIILMINPYSVPISLISYAITMIGFAPFTAVKFAMVSDTVEYGEWKTGVRNEGMIFGAATVGQKIGTGLGTALTGWLLAFTNYIPNAKFQPQSTMNAILWLMIGVPLIISVIQTIILWKYNLDNEYAIIVKELDEVGAK